MNRSADVPETRRPEFDEGRLTEYMRANVDGFRGPLQIERLTGGQSNPTYLLTAGGTQYALRRKPPGKLLPSAHAVEREYRVMSALRSSDVPVPRTYALCNDDAMIGTPFFIMEYVAGRIMWDQSLPAMTPAERTAHYGEMNRVIAALHRVDFAGVGLADYGKAGNYFARQIARWSKQYQASLTESIPAMDCLIEWLPQHIPPGDETTIVHGDFRLDNLIFHPTAPRILAVIDWELSTLGHPLADFSYHCMSWHIPTGVFRGIAGLDHAALGIPSEAEYIAAYCARTGRERIEHWDFYLAYNLFRIAAILQGIMGRVRDGTAASADARDAGRRARPLAELGWRIAQRVS